MRETGGRFPQERRSSLETDTFTYALENNELIRLQRGKTVDIEAHPASSKPYEKGIIINGVTISTELDTHPIAMRLSSGFGQEGILEISSTEVQALQKAALRESVCGDRTNFKLREIVEGELIKEFLEGEEGLVAEIGVSPGELSTVRLIVDLI